MEILRNCKENEVWIKQSGFICLFIHFKLVAVARSGMILKNENWDFEMKDALEGFVRAITQGVSIQYDDNGISIDPVFEAEKNVMKKIVETQGDDAVEFFYVVLDHLKDKSYLISN
jgi:hypothetical protein|tara:strand:+ start:229 stop:576 length:348 start_codon:yes stop_codon:yes gene_type:complete